MIVSAWAVAAALAMQAPPATDPVRAVIQTSAGDITVALEPDRAPVTTCNFLRYVQVEAYDGGTFFRTVVAATNANPHPIDVIQAATRGGSDDPGLGTIPLERTRDTGLSHIAGTISMARDGPDTATSSFFIVTRDSTALDFGGGRNPDGQGFAAFGRVIEGLEMLRAIQLSPATDEQLSVPAVITGVQLLDAVPAACRR
jgi:peptidyl-prolyl cis-trans isomerase A (cyclophilin A)